jgi:tetratricopeptide (TPR) repeat protein
MELKPGFSSTRLANLYLLRGDYIKAESLCTILLADGDRSTRSQGRMSLAKIPIHQGKFREAIRKLEIGIDTDRMESVPESVTAMKVWLKRVLAACIGNAREAIDYGDREIKLLMLHDPHSDQIGRAWAHIARYHARLGNGDAADSILSYLLENTKERSIADSAAYWRARAFVSQEFGHYDTAIVYWEKLKNADPVDFSFLLYSGISHLEAGHLGKAVSVLEKAMNTYGDSRAYWPHLSVLGHYWLAQAYEASGWDEKAIDQYETFLDTWKDADPGIESVEDAKMRLARLQIKT